MNVSGNVLALKKLRWISWAQLVNSGRNGMELTAAISHMDHWLSPSSISLSNCLVEKHQIIYEMYKVSNYKH